MGRVGAIRDSSGHADMIQDLNDLSVLGNRNKGPLEMIKFDMSILEKAAETSDEMARLLTTATS